MSLTLPVEELCRFTVSAKISSRDGRIGLALKPSLSKDSFASANISSGLSVHFETVEADGGSVLSVFTSFIQPVVQPTSQLVPTQTLKNIHQKQASDLVDVAPCSSAFPNWLPEWSDSFIMEFAPQSLSFQGAPVTAPAHESEVAYHPSQSNALNVTQVNSYLNHDNCVTPDNHTVHNYTCAVPPTNFNNVGPDDTFFCPSPSTSASQTEQGIPEQSSSDKTFCESPPSSDTLQYTAPPPQRWRRVDCLHPDCDRQFVSVHTRRIHMRIHEPKARQYFPCTMGCTEAFSRKHDRMRHEVTKHGRECKWSCKQCRRFFSLEKTLKDHKCSGQTISRWSIPVETEGTTLPALNIL